MNKSILRIALPSIVSNVTVPLLALADTAIVGHLGAASFIGAIAIGGMIFNMMYWLCGFLRMGTGGLTAQACGAGNRVETHRILLRSLAVAVALSLLLMLLQKPVADAVFGFVTATPDVERHARRYFSILIWGAPAVLGLYGFTGWFLGMQNARFPMAIAIVQNVVNIVASLALVVGCGWRVEGVATGTLVAQYVGLFMALGLWAKKYRHGFTRPCLREVFGGGALSRFFAVNRDIFLRTLCLIGVTTTFTSLGSAQGELVLASNALLMQFYFVVSYVMDGFAYAGEAIGGRFYGAKDGESFRRLTRRLFVWGGWLAAGFALVYFLLGSTFITWLTDELAVRSVATSYLPFAIALPVVSFAAFLFDGLFIGATATRLMLVSMAAAAAAFFLIVFTAPPANGTLWLAFLIYLGGRGAVQGLLYKKLIGNFAAGAGKIT